MLKHLCLAVLLCGTASAAPAAEMACHTIKSTPPVSILLPREGVVSTPGDAALLVIFGMDTPDMSSLRIEPLGEKAGDFPLTRMTAGGLALAYRTHLGDDGGGGVETFLTGGLTDAGGATPLALVSCGGAGGDPPDAEWCLAHLDTLKPGACGET